MKKKSLLSLLGLMLMAVCTLTACGGDDDDPLSGGSTSGNIVGEWATVSYDDSGSYMYMERINFKSNGSFDGFGYDCYGNNLNNGGNVTRIERTDFSGTYTASNGNITMVISGTTFNWSYKFKDGQLLLTTNQGTAIYDKMDDSIRQIFNSAEQYFQNQ